MRRRILFKTPAVAVIATALIFGGVQRASAQNTTQATAVDADRFNRPVIAWGGINFITGVPTGEFANYIDAGFGVGVNGAVPLKHDSPLALRGDLGFLVYGSETKRVCFSETVGCRVELDVTTTNSIFFGNIGPQLMMTRGAIRPYINAGIGFAYFNTSSGVDGSSNNEDFARTTNFSDATMAYAAGGGLLFRLTNGNIPVMIDVGARYNSNGSVEYLKKGDIHDNPDGSITFTPTRSDANLVVLNLGVSLGIRPTSHK
jgi:opacity protein-like surface antigen